MTVVHVDGPADAPALVLLHAIATSSALWAPQVPALAGTFRVVRVDLPGHGASAPLAADAGAGEYADAVAAALTERGVDEFTLVGLSFGAMIAMQLAARHPFRVRGVALMCCSAVTPPELGRLWRERADAVAADGMDGQVAPTLARWFSPAFAASSPTTLGWIGELVRRTPPAGFTAAAGIIAGLDHTALLTRLTVPCLVLAGTGDRAAPVGTMKEIAAAVPGAEFATVDAAHLANVEAPVAVTERLAAFARSL